MVTAGKVALREGSKVQVIGARGETRGRRDEAGGQTVVSVRLRSTLALAASGGSVGFLDPSSRHGGDDDPTLVLFPASRRQA